MVTDPALLDNIVASLSPKTRQCSFVALNPLALIIQMMLVLVLATPARAEVRLIAAVDEAEVGTPFELIIEAAQNRSVTGSPDLKPLQQDFRIHANRSVYLTEKRNGRTAYISRWTLSLSPLRAGTLVIPALLVKGEWSQPQRFQAHPKARPKAKPLLLKAILASPEGYPGSPLNFSVQLYYNIALQSAELTQPKIANTRLERRGEQLSYSATLNQQRYQVIEQQYWIQALEPGRYQIPPLQFKGLDSLGNVVNSQSLPLEFNITPLPSAASKPIQFIASQASLEQQWLESFDNIRAGDTLTRSITLEAQGIPAQWLPDIRLPDAAGISVYPQTPKLHQSFIDGVWISRKQMDFKLLLTQPGNIELPPLRLHWWDSARDQPQTASLESVVIQVAPFTAQSIEVTAATTTASDTGSIKPTTTVDNPTAIQWQAWAWALIAVSCAFGWTLSLQRNKRLEAELATYTRNGPAPQPVQPTQTSPSVTETKLQRQLNESDDRFAAFSAACQLNDAEQAYELIFDWAAAHWPEAHIQSLEDIQMQARDPTLSYLLKNLQHQLRDSSDSWHGDLLLERITRQRQKTRQPQPQPQPQRRHEPIKITIKD